MILPAKFPNVTRKVRRALEKDPSLNTEIISGIYRNMRKEKILEELGKFGITVESINNSLTITDEASAGSKKMQIKHVLELRKVALSHGLHESYGCQQQRTHCQMSKWSGQSFPLSTEGSRDYSICVEMRNGPT